MIPRIEHTGKGATLKETRRRMETREHVTVDPQALIGWHALPAGEQAYILETLEALAPQPPELWSNPVVQHLPTSEPLYLMRAHNGLLVIFRLTPGERITVLDLVLQETIERHFMPKSSSKPSESQGESSNAGHASD